MKKINKDLLDQLNLAERSGETKKNSVMRGKESSEKKVSLDLQHPK